jgi:hypothetical protein
MFESIKNILLFTRLKLNNLDFRKKQRYEGPLIDAMMQFNNNRTVESIKNNMEKHNISHMMIFARQNHSDSTALATEIKSILGNKIILGAPKRFDQVDDLTESFISDTIAGCNNGTYKFIGELQCVHADKHPSSWGNEVTLRGERYTDPLAPKFLELMDNLDNKNIPVMVHWEFYNWERDSPRFFELFKRYPNINFVIPHCGFGKAVYSNEILNRFKNVYMLLSKKEMFHIGRWWFTYKGYWPNGNGPTSKEKQSKLGSSMLNPNGKINYEWFFLLKRFPDKFMFATDCHKEWRWKHYDVIIDNWREILGQLDINLAEKIAFKNAKKLFNIES